MKFGTHWLIYSFFCFRLFWFFLYMTDMSPGINNRELSSGTSSGASYCYPENWNHFGSFCIISIYFADYDTTFSSRSHRMGAHSLISSVPLLLRTNRLSWFDFVSFVHEMTTFIKTVVIMRNEDIRRKSYLKF